MRTELKYRYITLPNHIDVLLVSSEDIICGDTDDEDDDDDDDDIDGGGDDGGADEGYDDDGDNDNHDDNDDDDGMEASVAVVVGVGYFADPPEVPGLAHFLEHMLFLGTRTHAGENDWEEWLAEHGGQSNGETDAEHTAFTFDVNQVSWNEDVFSNPYMY
jgi:nardilysin